MKGLNVDLLQERIPKAILIFALPILISLIFQNLYHLVDLAVVGNLLGTISLSAIGATTALYNLLISFSGGLGSGMSIVLGRSFGARDEDGVKAGAAATIVIGGILSLIFMLFAVFGLQSTLVMLNTPAEILDESMSYVFIITFCAGITFLFNLLSFELRAVGNSTAPLVFLVLASVTNIVLDIFFVVVCQMGVRGTAAATVAAQGLSAVLCIYYIYKHEPILVPSLRHFRFDRALYRELLGQGLSMGLMMAIVNCGSLAMQSAINALGSLTISANTAGRSIFAFTIMPINAIASSASTFVSQNRGARNYQRIITGVHICNLMSGAASLLNIIVCFSFGKQLATMIAGADEPQIIELAYRYVCFSACFYPVLGVLCNLRNSLQGLGKKVIPLVSSVIELLSKFVFTFFIIPYMGYNGVIIAEPLIWCVMTIQLVWAYLKERRILQEMIQTPEV